MLYISFVDGNFDDYSLNFLFMPSIPHDRAVIGRDIEDLRMAYGLSVEDARSLFGMTITKWADIVRHNPDVPVRDVSLALLVRLLDMNRDLLTPPEYPHPEEMKALFESIYGVELEQKKLSVLLGADGSSAYRWLKAGSSQNPSVRVLMLFLEKRLLSCTVEARKRVLQEWEQLVLNEGQVRTGKDVFKTGRWDRHGEHDPG